MAACNLLNGYEAANLDVLHADSDSDIDCSDDESEQETVAKAKDLKTSKSSVTPDRNLHYIFYLCVIYIFVNV
jgi:hypothetical protein